MLGGFVARRREEENGERSSRLFPLWLIMPLSSRVNQPSVTANGQCCGEWSTEDPRVQFCLFLSLDLMKMILEIMTLPYSGSEA